METGTAYLDIENVKEMGQKMLEEYMKISNKTADFDMSDTEINGSVEDQQILDRICTREHTDGFPSKEQEFDIFGKEEMDFEFEENSNFQRKKRLLKVEVLQCSKNDNNELDYMKDTFKE